jgi:O-antigen/teichoic acid export membrane protein
VFQALAYVISNIPMAMGSKKILFLYNSFLPGIISLIFSLLGYRLFGLMGLVYAFFVVNIFHFFTMYFVVRRKYNFLIQNNILKLIYIILLTLTLSLFVVLIAEGIVYYALIVLFVILISFITYYKSSQIFGFNFRDIWKYVRAEI